MGFIVVSRVILVILASLVQVSLQEYVEGEYRPEPICQPACAAGERCQYKAVNCKMPPECDLEVKYFPPVWSVSCSEASRRCPVSPVCVNDTVHGPSCVLNCPDDSYCVFRTTHCVHRQPCTPLPYCIPYMAPACPFRCDKGYKCRARTPDCERFTICNQYTTYSCDPIETRDIFGNFFKDNPTTAAAATAATATRRPGGRQRQKNPGQCPHIGRKFSRFSILCLLETRMRSQTCDVDTDCGDTRKCCQSACRRKVCTTPRK